MRNKAVRQLHSCLAAPILHTHVTAHLYPTAMQLKTDANLKETAAKSTGCSPEWSLSAPTREEHTLLPGMPSRIWSYRNKDEFIKSHFPSPVHPSRNIYYHAVSPSTKFIPLFKIDSCIPINWHHYNYLKGD